MRSGEHTFADARGCRSNSPPSRDALHVELDAGARLRRDLAHGAGEPGGAEVLHRGYVVALDELEAGLEEELLQERIADLDRRTLGLVALAQLERRQQRGTGYAVPAGVGADEVDRVAGPRAAGPGDAPDRRDADAHRVDERVLVVCGIEADVPGDVRDAQTVAVERDAADDSAGQVARAGLRRIAEEQRVEERDRPRAHGEHVAHDPADAGGGALERLDGTGVVVALDLEDAGEAAAEVDRAGVLAGPDDDVRRRRGQPAQERLRVL